MNVCVKLRIEISDGLPEDEVIIRCGRVDETVQKLHAYILGVSAPKISFYKGTQEYYLHLSDILFFETGDDQVHAHSASDAFTVKHRLYELEKMLPRTFVRAAKGTIVNTAHIYSINHNLTSPSQVKFTGTHKQIFVSRYYYNSLKERMNERSV
jgi:DNA-binding LytR/AlgR family response regulator